MSINDVEKRGRGRPPVESQPLTLRFPNDVVAAITKAAAAEPDPIPRSELIRRIVTEWLQSRGLMPPATTDALLDHEDAERQQQANVDAKRRAARVRQGTAATGARSRAAGVVDVEMKTSSASVDEKSRRRRSLTDEPAAVTKARAKRRQGAG